MLRDMTRPSCRKISVTSPPRDEQVALMLIN
jgi:hypothetical protein